MSARQLYEMPSHEMIGKTRAKGSIEEVCDDDGKHFLDNFSQTSFRCVKKNAAAAALSSRTRKKRRKEDCTDQDDESHGYEKV